MSTSVEIDGVKKTRALSGRKFFHQQKALNSGGVNCGLVLNQTRVSHNHGGFSPRQICSRADNLVVSLDGGSKINQKSWLSLESFSDLLPFDKGCLHLHLPGIYPVNKASTHGIVFTKTFHLQVDGQGAFSHLCHITTEVFKLSSRIGMDLTSILWSKAALMRINRSFSPGLNTTMSCSQWWASYF